MIFRNLYSGSFLSVNGYMIKIVCTYVSICEYECSQTENKECNDENVVVKHILDRMDEFLECCYKDDDMFRCL